MADTGKAKVPPVATGACGDENVENCEPSAPRGGTLVPVSFPNPPTSKELPNVLNAWPKLGADITVQGGKAVLAVWPHGLPRKEHWKTRPCASKSTGN